MAEKRMKSVSEQQKIDKAYAKATWEAIGQLPEFAGPVATAGLWESERIIFKRYLQPSDRILDIGCGTGRTTIGLYREGYHNILGVDVAGTMVETARAQAAELGYPIEFEAGDATALELGKGSFNAAIFSAQGLMSIPGAANRRMVFHEVSRVLTRGGAFIFTSHDRNVPDRWNEFWLAERARWDSRTQDPRVLEFGDRIVDFHGQQIFIHIPSRDEVLRVIKGAGMVLVEDRMRSEICTEQALAEDFSADCRFWVVRKP